MVVGSKTPEHNVQCSSYRQTRQRSCLSHRRRLGPPISKRASASCGFRKQGREERGAAQKCFIDDHERDSSHKRRVKGFRPADQRQDPKKGRVGDHHRSYRRSGGAVKHFFAAESWAKIGASEAIVEAVERLGMPKPSHVQAAAYKALHAGAFLPLRLYDVMLCLHCTMSYFVVTSLWQSDKAVLCGRKLCGSQGVG
jgi:hypothetical protein